MQSRPLLSALTHVLVGKGAVYQADFLRCLLAIAPNITHVDAELRTSDDPGEIEPADDEQELVMPPTKLKHLRIEYDQELGGDPSEEAARNHILDLVRQSSDLVQLSFGYD